MIRVSKRERKSLEEVGLIKYKRKGVNYQDANIVVANREHLSKSKTSYITEEPEIMKFLGRFEDLNMQKISRSQLKQLEDQEKITDENIQKSGEYKPKAFIYIKNDGIILMDKIAKYMLALGIWKNRINKQY